MAKVGRDLWVYLAQPLSKQGHPEQALVHIQEASEQLKRGDYTTSGQPVLNCVTVFSYLHSTEVLPDVQRETPLY